MRRTTQPHPESNSLPQYLIFLRVIKNKVISYVVVAREAKAER